MKRVTILYAEKNELQTLLNKQESQFQIRPTTTTRRMPLASISLNELSIAYEDSRAYQNARDYENSRDYEKEDNNYKSDREKIVEELHNVAIKKFVLMYYII
jgi:hypothetical protein